MSNAATRILIAEADDDKRNGLRKLFQNNNGCEVVGEAETISAAFWIGEATDHDLGLISSKLLVPEQHKLVADYKKQSKARSIIAYDIPDNGEMLRQFNRIGIDGFIGCDVPDIEFRTAVRTVTRGGSYFSPTLVDALFQRKQSRSDKGNQFSLTSRELEILSLLANGYCNKEVANAFDLSVRTVETHRLNIRRKTSANTLSDLVRIARDLDIMTIGDPFEETTSPGQGSKRIAS